MNRDAVIATIIGIIIGLGIAGVVLLGPRISLYFGQISLPKLSFSLPFLDLKKVTNTQKKETQKTENIPESFTIVSPLPNAIISESEVMISGTTYKNSMIIITGPKNEEVVQAGNDGKFSANIKLDEGINNIYTTTYSENNAETLNTVVYQTSESL